MIYDFTKTFNTYDAKSYKKEDFSETHCPKCPAIGRFGLHGSYHRHAIYIGMDNLICARFEIKRIKCISCKTTHAVMPGDLIPYESVSLFLFMRILILIYLRKIPILKIAEKLGFSHQFIYSVKHAFLKHLNNIRQHIRETLPEGAPDVLDARYVVAFAKESAAKLQFDYVKTNRRPCFMSKFFDKRGAPPVGLYAPRGAST